MSATTGWTCGEIWLKTSARGTPIERGDQHQVMEGLRDFLLDHLPLTRAFGAFAIGGVFGATVLRTGFCTMGAIADWVNFGDPRRFRSWLLAIATALIATQGLAAAGLVDLTHALYLQPRLDWLGALLGGAMMGVGMVLAGGCASRNLVRAGAGDLRAGLVVIIIGLCGFMTLGGVLGPIRARLTAWTALDLRGFGFHSQGLPHLFAEGFGLPLGVVTPVAWLAISASLLAVCFSSSSFRASPVHVRGGFVVGLLVAAGWALNEATNDAFEATADASATSLTFVRPIGDTLEWLERFTANTIPSFGVASVLGTVSGSLLVARRSGSFRLATFAGTGDTVRNLAGGALMGVGGVLALGCSIGQGITGVSTLALGSGLTFASLCAGVIMGLRLLERLDV